MPTFSKVSEEELSFPLAYAITAYMDPRNLGSLPWSVWVLNPTLALVFTLNHASQYQKNMVFNFLEVLLATIFRPHNSYCIHVDPYADETFRLG